MGNIRNFRSLSAGSRAAGWACALALVATLPACSKPAGDGAKGAATTAAAAPQELDFTGRAEAFRLESARDPLMALRLFSTPPANLRMTEIGGEAFLGMDQIASWRMFFTTALGRVARQSDDAALVGYYHPWSDTMLVTRWARAEDGTLKLAGADMVPGQVIRGAKPPFSAAPGWQGDKVFAPESLARTTAQTMRAFAADFGGANADPLAALDPKLKASLPLLAALPLQGWRDGLAPLYAGKAGDGAATAQWLALRAEAESGKIVQTGEIGDSLRLLGALDARLRASFVPVIQLRTDKAELLMLSAQIRPQIVAYVQIDRSSGTPKLRQFALIDLADFTEALTRGDVQ